MRQSKSSSSYKDISIMPAAILLIVSMLLILPGCATLNPVHAGKCILGISTRHLERFEPKFPVTANMEYDRAFDRTLEFIKKDMQAKLWLVNRRKHRIVALGFHTVYANTIDTTEVGFFFNPSDAGSDSSAAADTVIKVVSLNSALAEWVSNQYITALNKPDTDIGIAGTEQKDPDMQKAQSDTKKAAQQDIQEVSEQTPEPQESREDTSDNETAQPEISAPNQTSQPDITGPPAQTSEPIKQDYF